MKITASSALLVALALLSGCTADEPPPPKAPKVAQKDWVGEIRAEAENAPSAVQVMPFANPAVEDLRRTAARLEAEGDFDDAKSQLEHAIRLEPQDPTLWQSLAELSLQRQAWNEAEQQATKAYELGPKLGALCVRNWLTVRAARLERGQVVDAESAKAQVPSCQVASPIRM
ncbi:MAG TPA: tetratricopeptide repeat protein [Xanthomonadales bacterium]|nr:tetratricopeptide repeat protein [Xanthomonadales bacterium]